MSDPRPGGQSPKWLWPLLVLVAVGMAALWFARPAGEAPPPEAPVALPGPSDEWTEAPEGGVDVTLPQVKMKDVLVTPAPEASGDADDESGAGKPDE